MAVRTGRELDDAEGANLACRPETSPANALATAARGSAAQPHPTSQGCSCFEASQSSRGVADIGPDGDHGRRLRYIIVAWFSTCLVVLVLLAHSVEDDAQWSELHSERDQHRRVQVTSTSHETG